MPVETQLLDQAGRMAQQAGVQIAQQSGGFLWSLLASPFNLLGSMARKGFAGVISWGLPLAAVTGGVMAFAPDLFRGLGELTGRTDVSDRMANAVRDGGVPQAALIALGTGAALGGGIGALSGAWQSVTGGGEGEAPQSTGASVGRTIGTVATFATVAAITIGAMNHGVRHDAGGERSVTPPPTPTPNAGAPRHLDA